MGGETLSRNESHVSRSCHGVLHVVSCIERYGRLVYNLFHNLLHSGELKISKIRGESGMDIIRPDPFLYPNQSEYG